MGKRKRRTFGAKLIMPVDMKAAAIAEGCGDIVPVRSTPIIYHVGLTNFLVPQDFARSPDDRRTGPGIDDVSQ